MKVTILGCGAAHGIPAIGYGWGICDPTNLKNRRNRASVFIEVDGLNILIDATPDIRFQFLENKITHLDAVLFTHTHADHCHGINDLKFLSLFMKRPIPIYGSEETLKDLFKRFFYVFFKEPNSAEHHTPFLTPYIIKDSFLIKNTKIICFDQDHGASNTLGFRIHNFAYSTDVVSLDEKAFNALKGIEVWVVDCLRYEPAKTHAHLDLTLKWIKKIKPKRAILTHMNHEIDYEILRTQLPQDIEPAYDGMVIDL